MQKTDFITRVAEQTGVSKKVARQVIDAAIDVISQSLTEGEKVVLPGFGTFEVRQRQERRGVNPQTHQSITIAASKTPGFSASSALKEAVKGRQEVSRLGGGWALPGEEGTLPGEEGTWPRSPSKA
jgi:DNA-binding protein HU-beta